MNSGMIILNQSIKTMQNYAIWIQKVEKDFYEDIAHNVGKRFDTSNYEVNRPLHC